MFLVADPPVNRINEFDNLVHGKSIFFFNEKKILVT